MDINIIEHQLDIDGDGDVDVDINVAVHGKASFDINVNASTSSSLLLISTYPCRRWPHLCNDLRLVGSRAAEAPDNLDPDHTCPVRGIDEAMEQWVE